MKSIIKLIGIIAFVAVIGFSFAGCDDGGGGNDSGNSNDYNNSSNNNNNNNSNNNSDNNNGGTQQTSAPSTPTGVTATAASSSSITVSWSSVSNTTGYYIYRSSSSSGTYSQVGSSTTTSYTNTGLSANTTYYYKVAAYNSGGTSSQSSSVSAKTTSSSSTDTGTAPDTPTNVTATAASSSSITVKWNSVSNVIGYSIYRSSTYSGTFSLAGSSTTNSYTDTGLSANTTYYYKVEAYNDYGISSKSITTGSATTLAGPAIPGTPTNVSASAQSSSSIKISWSAPSSGGTPAYYNILRSTSSGGTYTEIDYVSGITLSYTDTGLSASTTYYYKVESENSAGGKSSPSSAVSATTSASTSSSYGSVLIQNNSVRDIKNLTLYQQGYDLIGGTGFYLRTVTITSGSSATLTNLPAGTYVRIGSETYNGYKLNKNSTFTVTAGQTTTVTIISSDVVAN